MISLSVTIGGEVYVGESCNTEKEAQESVCRVAVQKILNAKGVNVVNWHLLPKNLFSVIGDTIAQKFNVIRLGDVFKFAKCFAAILRFDSDSKTLEVVSLGSGNKISQNCSARDETTLNDFHGEILARRAFIRQFIICYNSQEFSVLFMFSYFSYLYLHIINDYDKESFMFEKSLVNCKLELKSKYSFHLYISTAPCGDGRTFLSSDVKIEIESAGVINCIKNVRPFHEPIYDQARTQGLLRCKVEAAQGTIPVSNECGDRLRIMSCSDKILKWNVLGIQGSLLATLLEPIYLSSITIGSLYHSGHLSRAVCCRLHDSPPLPAPYRVNHPLLGQRFIFEKNYDKKDRDICINWNLKEEHCEMIDYKSGKRFGVRTNSRLCKTSLFELYQQTKGRFGLERDNNCLYKEAKKADKLHSEVKKWFYHVLKSKNFGDWLTAEET